MSDVAAEIYWKQKERIAELESTNAELRKEVEHLREVPVEEWQAVVYVAQIAELRAENERLNAAIRKHRDAKGDDRCWLDDAELYAVLPEGSQSVTFCEPVEMLENCKKFIAKRHDKAQPYVSPQREIERLTKERDERISDANSLALKLEVYWLEIKQLRKAATLALSWIDEGGYLPSEMVADIRKAITSRAPKSPVSKEEL